LQFHNGLRIVLAESEERTLLRDVLQPDADGGVTLAVGPEGGWTEDELLAFQQAGWISASLGSTILRAETAAIAATVIAASALFSL
jgi:16S rRNA (uracil1498-N3)-methyltransferase